VWMMQRPPAPAAPAAAPTTSADVVADLTDPTPANAGPEIGTPKSVVEPAQSTSGSRSVQPAATVSQTSSQSVTPVQPIVATSSPVPEPLPGLARDLDLVRLGVTAKPAAAAPVQPVARSIFENPARFEPPTAGAIYGDTDDDITPPSVLYPRFPDPAEARKARADMFMIEVVVNEHGDVAMAKARTLPRSISESLFLMNLLSSAKSWRFDPAKKGIYPVKYRYFVELAAN
jgi:hypothetical protein